VASCDAASVIDSALDAGEFEAVEPVPAALQGGLVQLHARVQSACLQRFKLNTAKLF